MNINKTHHFQLMEFRVGAFQLNSLGFLLKLLHVCSIFEGGYKFWFNVLLFMQISKYKGIWWQSGTNYLLFSTHSSAITRKEGLMEKELKKKKEKSNVQTDTLH